jgi:hypothetical protein
MNNYSFKKSFRAFSTNILYRKKRGKSGKSRMSNPDIQACRKIFIYIYRATEDEL